MTPEVFISCKKIMGVEGAREHEFLYILANPLDIKIIIIRLLYQIIIIIIIILRKGFKRTRSTKTQNKQLSSS